VDEADPHIHVDVNLHADVTVRDMMSATFGLVGDLPTHASTGCGLQVPYAMTSMRPENVTCLACREHAHRRYLELAGYVGRLSQTPGTSVGIRERAARAAEQYLDIARRFAEPQT
jgi:hypothetical protein